MNLFKNRTTVFQKGRTDLHFDLLLMRIFVSLYHSGTEGTLSLTKQSLVLNSSYK